MIFHAFTSYVPKDTDTARRNRVAQQTWTRQPWTELPVKDEDLPRLWKEEGRLLPYIKDVFDFACKGKDDTDIIVYTNADIMVRGDACAVIAAAMQDTNALYVYRRDFHHRVDAPIPDADYVKGADYAGSDLKAFRVGWWKGVRDHFPDMLLGFEAWDPIMRHLIEMTNPGRVTRVKDIICHERHGSWWEAPENRYRLNGQKYSLRTAYLWLMQHGIDPGKHGIRVV